ncbi:MAG: hypothetical protein HC794_05040 [Nitrospiraceae bacterium]|nr:hypothetical protein [Nitrospiraceae bacterium]
MDWLPHALAFDLHGFWVRPVVNLVALLAVLPFAFTKKPANHSLPVMAD